MYDLSTGSDSVIGSALMRLGITVYMAATADHSPAWFIGDTTDKLKQRFGMLFTRDAKREGKTIIVVDSYGRQYVVANIHELECVWRKAQIAHAFSMPNETFELLRGDIVQHPVPELAAA